MPALPDIVSTTAIDADSDDPKQARVSIHNQATAINSIRDYLNGLFGATGAVADAKTALGLGNVVGNNVGEGLESISNLLRVKLDGASLARSATGIKIADAGIILSMLANQTQGGLVTFGAGNAPTLLAPGAADYVLKSQGAGANLVWGELLPGSLENIQVITATGTYTKSAGVTKIIAFIIGGGGGGSASGGGGGAGLAILFLDVTAIASIACTIGNGGAAGPAVNTLGAASGGGNGGTTSLGSYASATGGGGAGSITGHNPTNPGAGGIGVGGTINCRGSTGGRVMEDSYDAPDGQEVYGWGGYGGAPPFLGGGSYATAGLYGGGGGSGQFDSDGTDAAGFAGAQGVIMIFEFL